MRVQLPRICLLVLTLLVAACAENATSPAGPMATTEPGHSVTTRRCSILMGWDPWEPYQYRDVDGRMRGLDVELAHLIASEAGCTLRFEEGRWGSLVRQLQEGNIDMLAAATRTPSRESFAYFSAPYRAEDFKLYVRAGEASKYPFTDLTQLLSSGFRVGVTEQYVYGDAISRLQGNPAYADLFVGATIGEINQQRLLDRKLEGLLEDPFVMAQAFRNKGLDSMLEAHPIQVHSGEVTFMFSKASVAPEVIERINQSIATVKADGRRQAIIDKYLR